jgi:hypothetical protein
MFSNSIIGEVAKEDLKVLLRWSIGVLILGATLGGLCVYLYI